MSDTDGFFYKSDIKTFHTKAIVLTRKFVAFRNPAINKMEAT